MNIVQKKAEHLAVRNVILKAVFFAFACKDNANRKQNKMNLFIFYADVQFLFAFSAKITQTTGKRQLYLCFCCNVVSFHKTNIGILSIKKHTFVAELNFNIMTNPHLAVLIHKQAEKYGNRVALRYRDYETEQWIPVSWNQFSAIVKTAACALLELGIKGQENIGIFSQNKPECLYVDFAAFANRAVSIPLYATSSESQVQYIVNDASIRYLFVGEQFQYEVASRIYSLCPTLQGLVIFDRSVKRNPEDTTSLYFDEFLKMGEASTRMNEVEDHMAQAKEDDLANILYTSGTTGDSKGVMLHHSCYIEAFRIHKIRLTTMSDKDVVMDFLPLTHIFEKAWTYLCLYVGCEICINLRPAEIQKTIKEIRPTLMCAVPRFWEKVYAGVQEKINSATGVTRMMMLDAIRVGRAYNLTYKRVGKEPPLWLSLKYKFYEKTVFSLLKKTVGIENGNFFPTAGAAIPPAVEEFIHAVGINMVAGYGLTESTATVSCDVLPHYSIGSVGRVMPDVEVKIGENSEILLRGKTITKGYYKKESITNRAIDAEGWFHTGDAGYLKDGELFLTERLKDLFKTSNGKYIAPQAIESQLVVDRYIDQIAIIADQRKFVSALIIPTYDLVEEYAKKHHITYGSMAELLQNEAIIALFKERIDTLQQQFAHYEQIKNFTLLPEPFSMKKGELTDTLKIRRPVLYKNYAAEIERMYEE